MFGKILITLVLIFMAAPSDCRKSQVINFRWPNLYPESFTWDPSSDHFIVGSLRHRQLISVSDAGIVTELLADESLPSKSSIIGIEIDPRLRRLLVVIFSSSPPFSGVAAYDLPTFHQIFLTQLDHLLPNSTLANDVTVDYSGNAYVTDSANDAIYKITEQGEAKVLSRAQAFKSHPVDTDAPYRDCGLNGIIYNSKGYLLVTQSNTGKLFKVNADNGSTTTVILNKDLPAADGMAARSDGVVLVVSASKLYFLQSEDSWRHGVVFDETALEKEGHASAVSVGAENRVYVLYGHIDEGMTGNTEREEFSIVEVVSDEESRGEDVWILVLVGFGLACFLFWRFQMGHLGEGLNKKTS